MNNTIGIYKNLLKNAAEDRYTKFYDLPRARRFKIAVEYAKNFPTLSVFDDYYVWSVILRIVTNKFNAFELQALKTEFIEALNDDIQEDLDDIIAFMKKDEDPLYLDKEYLPSELHKHDKSWITDGAKHTTTKQKSWITNGAKYDINS